MKEIMNLISVTMTFFDLLFPLVIVVSLLFFDRACGSFPHSMEYSKAVLARWQGHVTSS